MRSIFFIINFLCIALLISCTSEQKIEKLIIFHAGSLSVPFKDMEAEFNKKYPNILILREACGSRVTARKVTELKKPADIIAVADYKVIEDILMPEYTDWYIAFATNKMVIAYNDKSRYANEINADNWYEVIMRAGVNYGHSDPNSDPCGYRTLLLWQLAEKYYKIPELYKKLQKHCPKKNIRPKETDLIALTQVGELDYHFQYLSVAKQHNLKYLILPEQIDLSSIKYADFYKQANVKITGRKPGTWDIQTGKPIVYAITIPNTAPNKEIALKFIKFVLSKTGREIMTKSGQLPISPPIANDINKIPVELQGIVNRYDAE
jgi:molybdate/tungstate transport system substrate-binding protein